MERLTTKIYDNNGNQQNIYDWSCVSSLEYNKKLGKLEDLMEKYNCDDIEDLENKLKNAIVPKFKIGQEVWYIDSRMNSFGEIKNKIYSYVIAQIEGLDFRYYGNDGLYCNEDELFATTEEAEKKLEELKE